MNDPLAPLVEHLAGRIAARVLELLAARESAPQPANDADGGLVAKRALAATLGVSVSTVDRFAREGMPHEVVGTRKRFDVTTCRAWLQSRGRKPTKATTHEPHVSDAELDDLALAAGLRRR